MAIQPCHTCGRPVQSDEYFAHNVACSSESCQRELQESGARMQAALERAAAEIRARQAVGAGVPVNVVRTL